MVEFIGKHYVSPDGAEALRGLRVSSGVKPTGTAPISLLARVPSDECGCPEELWRIDGIELLFHFEDDGPCDAFIFAGDWDAETSIDADTLDDLRAKAFQWLADMMRGADL